MTDVNLARVNLVSLRLIALCANEATLGDAADRAHPLLAGASHRLSSFERQLGPRLFERHHSGLTATARGAELIDEVKNLLAVEHFCARAMTPQRQST